MILAAGRGERLRPLTDTTPKALIEINHQPLIVHHILNLKKAGITDIVINLAHLGHKIKNRLGTGQHYGINIEYSQEPAGGLETGGGIVKALSMLGSDSFITVNADIYSDYPLEQLTKSQSSQAHLVLVDNPSHNPDGDYAIEQGMLSNLKTLPQYTFSGIALYHPSFFEGCGLSKFSVTPLVRNALIKQQITAEHYNGLWHDIGTIQRLKRAQASVKDAC